MNTMKEKPWTVLVISVILQCFGEVDAHNVHLDPSPIAKVEEGNTLILHCICNGSNTPDFINWYLNNDTFGLVIEASSCNYLSTPGQYEIDRYSISCHETKFNLSIANISKDRDDQDTWKCDTTVIGMVPPQKSSTTIVVIDAVATTSARIPAGSVLSIAANPSSLNLARPADTKSGQFDEPKTVVVVVVVTVVVVGVIAVIITVAGCFVYRKRINGHDKKRTNREHLEGDEQIVMDLT